MAWQADWEKATGVGWGGWESGGAASEKLGGGARGGLLAALANGRRAEGAHDLGRQPPAGRAGAARRGWEGGCSAGTLTRLCPGTTPRKTPRWGGARDPTPACAGGARREGRTGLPQPSPGRSRAVRGGAGGGRRPGVSVRLATPGARAGGRWAGRALGEGRASAAMPVREPGTRTGRRPRGEREGGLETGKTVADCAGWTRGWGVRA